MAKAPQQHSIPTSGSKHVAAQRHKARDRRSSARERGYTTAWDKFSKSFLRRNPLCEFCNAKGRVEPARVTDHDIPHEHDPDLFWDNTFTALCHRCHNSTKQRLEAKHKGDALLDAVQALKGASPWLAGAK